MPKRICVVIYIFILLSLGGCASMFEKEYYSASEYIPATAEPGHEGGGVIEITSYSGLKAAISILVTTHEETGVLSFKNYDGNVSDDLASASKEVSTKTALGAYCVDYISYDIERVVAYYEAKIYVYYTRSAEETKAIASVQTVDGIVALCAETLESMGGRFAIMVNTRTMGVNEIRDCVERAWQENPTLCVRKPMVTVEMYSGSGIQKLFEISIDYGGDREALLSMREELSVKIGEITEAIIAEGDVYRALSAAGVLVNTVETGSAGGSTAYAAAVEGLADSEGMALAYAALCRELSIPCMVVSGRLDTAQHYWNMIEIEGDWYHVDLAETMTEGYARTFLMGDNSMWGRYWWDTERYPACEGELSYAVLLA